jgi:riboflavin synthase
MYTVGIVDTTFSRADMAKYAIQALTEHLPNIKILRYTVPGIKDIPVAAKRLLESSDITMTFGWVGPTPTDKYSYLTMSIGLTIVQILTGKHVIDVTVHEDETEDVSKLYEIAINRAKEHALNVVALLKGKSEALTRYAGKGLRQGSPNVGPLR